MQVLLLCALPLAWLVPNHYLPWISAWQEAPALALIAVACAVHRQQLAMPLWWAAALAVACVSVLAQWATGRILYSGDAVMVLFYGTSFAGAIVAGSALSKLPSRHGWSGVEALAVMLLAGAVASFGIALVQWSHVFSLGIYAADLPPGGRPFANVAQPNLLCSVFFLGLCGAALLHASARLHIGTLSLLAVALVAGMAMTGSRTGWLQFGLLAAAAMLARHRADLKLRPVHLAVAASYYVAAVAAWPVVNRVLMLTGGRGVIDQIQGGVRGPYWTMMLDAIGREVWGGYGWLQSGSAQVAVALDHPPLMRQFEYSHNLVIELLLYVGVPLGLTIVALGATALFAQARAVRDPQSFWLTVAVGGLVTHAMLEYPLHYAFFLMPCGVMIGAASALSPPGRTLILGNRPVRILGVALLGLVVAVSADYIKAEENLRTLRMENARIGTDRVGSVAPQLWVLTQLEALLHEARVMNGPTLSAEALERLRRITLRYPFSNLQLKYAEALTLNGQADEGRLTIERLCRIHAPQRCADARAKALHFSRTSLPE